MKHKSILVTAPSGAGKTTLVKMLLSEMNQFEFSISATTRPRRNNEIDGVDYHFISDEDFMLRVKNNDFLEWEEVYNGTKYGTLRSEVAKIESHHKIPLFDIDIHGAMSIKKILCENVLSIFIAPPSLEVLEERLRSRNTETEDKITQRIFKAKSELKFENFFDKKIVNDNLEESYSKFKNYIVHYLNQ